MSDLVKMSDIINIYNTYDSEKAREQVMKLLPINAVIIPDNATNGDMIKTIFPGTTGMGFDAQLNFEMHLDNEHNYHVGKFNQDWWNEPYVYKENKE